MTAYTRHPIGEAFGSMADDEFAALLDSMREHSYDDNEPVLCTPDAQIFDGWHRHRAALMEGIVPTYKVCDLSLKDILSIVERKHRARRNLPPVKMAEAMVKARIAAGFKRAEPHRPETGPDAPDTFTKHDIADGAGVSISTAKRAIGNVEKGVQVNPLSTENKDETASQEHSEPDFPPDADTDENPGNCAPESNIAPASAIAGDPPDAVDELVGSLYGTPAPKPEGSPDPDEGANPREAKRIALVKGIWPTDPAGFIEAANIFLDHGVKPNHLRIALSKTVFELQERTATVEVLQEEIKALKKKSYETVKSIAEGKAAEVLQEAEDNWRKARAELAKDEDSYAKRLEALGHYEGLAKDVRYWRSRCLESEKGWKNGLDFPDDKR